MGWPQICKQVGGRTGQPTILNTIDYSWSVKWNNVVALPFWGLLVAVQRALVTLLHTSTPSPSAHITPSPPSPFSPDGSRDLPRIGASWTLAQWKVSEVTWKEMSVIAEPLTPETCSDLYLWRECYFARGNRVSRKNPKARQTRLDIL